MIFRKSLRFARSFAVLSQIPQPKPITINPLSDLPPNRIFEFCDLSSKSKIEDFAKKSEILFEKEKTNSNFDRFFDLSLLYLKTGDESYAKTMKILEKPILEYLQDFKDEFMTKNDEKEHKSISQLEKVSTFLRSFLGVHILRCFAKNLNIKFEIFFQFLQKFPKVSQENPNLSKEEQLTLEILYLTLVNFKLNGLTITKESRGDDSDFTDVLAVIFQSYGCYPLYKKILLNSFENPKSISNRELIDSDFLWNIFLSLENDRDSNSLRSDFLTLLSELQVISNFSMKLSTKLLFEIIKIKRGNEENSNKFGLFCTNLIRHLGNNLQLVSTNEFPRILYQISKENITKYNCEVMRKFWEQVLSILPQKYSEASIYHQRSILYSIGKMGFINQTIKKKIYEVELNKIRTIKNLAENEAILEKYLNMMKSAVNLKVINTEGFKQFVENMEKALEKHPERLNKFRMDIAPYAIRVKYLEEKFWVDFFKNLETIVSQKGQHFFQFFFVLKVFHFLFNGNFRFIYDGDDAKQKFPEIYKSFTQAQNNQDVRDVFEKPLLQYYQEEIGGNDAKMENIKSSLLQETMNNCLNSLGTPFISQNCLEFLIVDFYLPIENIVVEVMGPSNFIKNGGKDEQMTLLTEFKLNCLKELGYGLIRIDYDHEAKGGVSIEQSFLKQYKKIITSKK